LAAFGGMGSLSDLTFHPINGNANNDEDGARGTERLRELTGAVYRDAEALRRSLDRP
jgi:hypothetical protein